MNKLIFKNKGFTLIETLIYLGLFGILIGGAVVAAYSLLEGNGRTQTRALIQEEGNFLIQKMNWALAGIKSIETPTVGLSNSQLSLIKWDLTMNPIVIGLTASDITISKNNATPVTLNNPDILVSNLIFDHIYDGGTSPESLKYSFTLTGKTPNGANISQNFVGEKFIRK
jgi:type II secretory pathway pseudopilin PulG